MKLFIWSVFSLAAIMTAVVIWLFVGTTVTVLLLTTIAILCLIPVTIYSRDENNKGRG